ncbi:MAG: PorT family protein [Bacteroides sp.]|nr:PorT family protein [Bacteroides sp.]MCM1412923.1 PorT family protein [Bacteroides sp.]MCM1471592.1 PorT family protein [Bacteroides sp.]
MTKRFISICVAVVAVIALAVPSQAQLRFGVKAGVTVNSLHFSCETFDSENRAGFTGGVMLEFTAPVSGLGVDLSAMYVRRNSRWLQENNLTRDDRDYIEIPLNLKWRMNIPLVNNICRPYLLTGPSFAFLTSRRSMENAYRNRSFDTSWNFGFGVELVKHLQVGATYGIGLTKALKTIGATGTSHINGRNRYWTITAAYMF